MLDTPRTVPTLLPEPPSCRRRWRKCLLVLLPMLVGLYALAGFFVVPWAVQKWGVPMASEQINGDVTVGTVRVNPFTLSATLEDVVVTDEAGERVLGAEGFYGNLQASSLVREGFVLRHVELDAPFVRAELLEDGTLNLASLAKPSDEVSAEPLVLPRLRGRGIAVINGRVEFVDRMVPDAPDRVFAPLTFDVGAFDTAAEHANAHRFSAATEAAENLTWEGEVFLNPLTASGTIVVEGLDLSVYQPYVVRYAPMEVKAGKASATIRYALAPAASPAVAEAEVEQARIEGLEMALEGETFFKAAHLTVDGVRADAAGRSVSVARAWAQTPEVQVVRRADGTLPMMEALNEALASVQTGETTAEVSSSASQEGADVSGLPVPLDEAAAALIELSREASGPWAVVVESVEVVDGASAWHDATTTPAVRYTLTQAQFKAGPTRSVEGFVMPFEASVKVHETGAMKMAGTAELLAGRAMLAMDATGLDLVPLAPYLAASAPMLVMNKGLFDVKGDVRAALPQAGEGDEGAAGVPGVPEVATDLLVVTGVIDIAVNDVEPNMAAALREISLKIEGLDTAGTEPGRLMLTTKLNDADLAMSGTMQPDLADPTRSQVELEMTLERFGLPGMTGYSGRYVGRAIDSGQLHTDKPITFSLHDQKLDIRVPLRIEEFNFGDKIESDQATSLPVGLAVAILKGADGTLEPPPLKISGDLSDPSISVAGIVFHAITKLITGVVASPFKMLGGAFGGGDEAEGDAADFSFVAFAPGSALLGEDATSKLDRMAEMLKQKPVLRVRLVAPPVSATGDDWALRRGVFMDGLRAQTAQTLSKRDPLRADPSQIVIGEAQYSEAIGLAHAAQPGIAPADDVQRMVPATTPPATAEEEPASAVAASEGSASDATGTQATPGPESVVVTEGAAASSAGSASGGGAVAERAGTPEVRTRPRRQIRSGRVVVGRTVRRPVRKEVAQAAESTGLAVMKAPEAPETPDVAGVEAENETEGGTETADEQVAAVGPAAEPATEPASEGEVLAQASESEEAQGSVGDVESAQDAARATPAATPDDGAGGAAAASMFTPAEHAALAEVEPAAGAMEALNRGRMSAIAAYLTTQAGLEASRVIVPTDSAAQEAADVAESSAAPTPRINFEVDL